MNQHMSNADLLTEVNMAIQKICIGGQSYQIGTKRLTRADLTQLYKMRNDLTAALQVEEFQPTPPARTETKTIWLPVHV